MTAQVWAEATKWNLLQLETMPTWVGTGVVTPLPADVVVVAGGGGSTPMMETQA